MSALQHETIPLVSPTYFASRLERVIQLEEVPLAPLVNGAMRKTEVAKKRAATERKKFYSDVAWLARKARIVNSFMGGESLAMLVYVTPRLGSTEDVDGRVKASLDAFNRGHACVWGDDRQVSVLIVERMAPVRGHGHMHILVGVRPVWPEYETAKAAWILANPAATQEQYNAAMLRISSEIGT